MVIARTLSGGQRPAKTKTIKEPKKIKPRDRGVDFKADLLVLGAVRSITGSGVTE
jgi:hypothetical protein